jgi:tetratricopeptide (TPR) repeat protein
VAAARKGGYSGKEADAGYHLCEQALDADPGNVVALTLLSIKFWTPVGMGASADPKADLDRADELVSRALAVDPNNPGAHLSKAWILYYRGSTNEAIAEAERALILDPTMVDAYGHLGWSHQSLGQFEKSPEYFDRAIRLSPHDPNLVHWYTGKSRAFLALKQYDQAIEYARRAIAISPSDLDYRHAILIAALALTGHEAEAHEALQRYLALYPSGAKTIAAWKVHLEGETDPRALELNDRTIEGLRKAGMPET